MLDPVHTVQTRTGALSTRFTRRVEQLRLEHRKNVSLLTRLTAHLGIIALVIIGLLLSGIQLHAAQQPRNYDEPATQDNQPDIFLNQESTSGDIRPSLVVVTIPSKKERRDVTTYLGRPGENVSVLAEG